MKVIKFKYLDIQNNLKIKSAVLISISKTIIIINFIKNNYTHNEKFQASYAITKSFKSSYYLLYNDFYYNNLLKNKSWLKKVKNLKRQYKLKMFK